MPSTIIGNQSGGQPLLPSGFFWSGQGPGGQGGKPVGGINLTLAREASGNVYVGLSGGVTINSGGPGSGGGPSGGYFDGMPLFPGASMFVPKCNLGPSSGAAQLYLMGELATSGQARVYWEAV